MRDGYLGALAARTLGVAPLLRPVTPSRFEPDGPTGHVDVAELSGTASERYLPSQPDSDSRANVLAEPAEAAPSPEAALLPPVDPDRPLPALAPAPMTQEWGGRNDAASPEPAGNADTAALGIATLAQAFAPTTSNPDTATAGPVADRASERTGPAAAHAGIGDPGQDHLGLDHAAAASPSVVVRIGRIDVRAGEMAPRPMLAPRPAAAAQISRTLADHLAARDRELS